MSQLMRLWYLSHRRTAKAAWIARAFAVRTHKAWKQMKGLAKNQMFSASGLLCMRLKIEFMECDKCHNLMSRLKYFWLRPILMELVRWRVDRRLLNKDICLAHVRFCTTEVTAMVEWKRPNLSLCHSPRKFLPIQVYILDCHSFLAEGRCFPWQIFNFRPYLLYWLSSESVK